MTSDPRERHLVRYLGGFAPFVVARAEGMWLETTDGRRLLDFSSGQICSTLGHRHPRVMAAVREALDTVVHLDSRMLSEPVLALADRLAELAPAPLTRVMPLSTGAEANEFAIKLAKMHTGRFEIVGVDPRLPRRHHRRRQLDLPAVAPRVRAAGAGHAGAAGAVRLPLPDPPLPTRRATAPASTPASSWSTSSRSDRWRP